MERGPGGNTHQHALLAADQPSGGKGILVGHRDDLIINCGIQYLRDESSADALDLMGPGAALTENRRVLGLHRHDFHRRILLLDVLPHTGDGAAGTHAGHEDVHFAAGVRPNFRAGGGAVGGRVGGVDKLAGDEAVGNLLSQLLRFGDGPLHPLGPFSQHQLRTVGPHQLPALHAHGFRHGDDEAVATGRR